jgi:5-methylcytosine-specific restriction protein A
VALLRICNGCFRPFDPGEMKRGRCIPCGKEYEREKSRRRRARLGTTSARGYGGDYQRLRAIAIQRQPWCSQCGATQNLTADHIVARADGGANVLSNLRVLCLSCNSARSGARRRDTAASS